MYDQEEIGPNLKIMAQNGLDQETYKGNAQKLRDIQLAQRRANRGFDFQSNDDQLSDDYHYCVFQMLLLTHMLQL